MRVHYHLVVIFNLFLQIAFAGDPDGRVTIFLDCEFCNEAQIKKELDYINFALDPYRSDLHVFISRQWLSSGGQQYFIEFIGKSDWEGEKVKFDFTSPPTLTSFEQNELIINKIEIGLVPFIAKTKLAEGINLEINTKESSSAPSSDDGFWNNFIFDLGGNVAWSSEATRKDFRLNTNMSIESTTSEWRLRVTPTYFYRHQTIQTNDEEVIATQTRGNFPWSLVKSIDTHWSAGIFNSYYTSNFSNIDLSIWLAPAIEYSIFPYSDVPEREFTVSYRLGYLYRDYIEETIFNKFTEQLYQQMLDVNLRMRRPWGNVFAGMSSSNFMNDWSKNRLVLNGQFSVRVFKGLSVSFGGNYELINDQISLPKGEVSLEDLLLAQRQQATSFQSSMNLGISYTFGAIYNNVINTRL